MRQQASQKGDPGRLEALQWGHATMGSCSTVSYRDVMRGSKAGQGKRTHSKCIPSGTSHRPPQVNPFSSMILTSR